MKIIQSFWSGGRNMLHDNFGWNSPNAHLMSWALSCLNIKNFYEEVELYTDKQGYEILIEQLHLPYTKVHVILDDLEIYPKDLWALAKIKAYSEQSKPFIHIDGDVFIYSKFQDRIHNAQLIAQNAEKATTYYQSKFAYIKKQLTYLPEFININVTNHPVCSYNAGIIGGKDLEFLKKYCREVFDFVDQNIFGTTHLPKHFLVNFNILFEQIFFYTLSRKEAIPVTCLFDEVFEDNGYKYDDLGDFTTVPYLKTFLHFIGPIKRNKRACDLLSSVLLRDHPQYFFKIATLFDKSFSQYYFQNLKNVNTEDMVIRYSKNELSKVNSPVEQGIVGCPEIKIQKSLKKYLKSYLITSDNTSERSADIDNILKAAREYETNLLEILEEFKVISHKYLIARNIDSTKHFDFFHQRREVQLRRKLERCPFVKTIETVFDWTIFNKEEICVTADLKIKEDASVIIAIVPEILYSAYTEIVLEELDYYILTLLENATTLEYLLEELAVCFNPDDITNNYENFFQLIMLKLKNLISNKYIRISDVLY